LMAVLFSVGLIITLSLYGVAVAFLGKSIGLMRVSQILYVLAGIFAFVFGLAELKLIRFHMPAYSKMPQFIQNRPDYFKALLLGLFLGNAGIGCPNPATYIILTHIAATGNVLYGVALQAVNGIGRALPLIALSILGILGVNATKTLLKKKKTITKATGWGLIIFGAVIIVWGVYGHYWFLNTPIHRGWTRTFGSIGGANVAEYECCVEPPCKMCAMNAWIWDDGSCKCRIMLEQAMMDHVCPECKVKLKVGMGVYDIAERTQWPAFSLLTALVAVPVGWYLWKKPYEKEEQKKEAEKKDE